MRTATLVLAILGNVFGGLGAVAGFVFGATLAGVSGGIAGEGAARGGVLALLALVLGIAATTVVSSRPRVSGVAFVGAAVLGTVGTTAFALGALLYLIAAGLAIAGSSRVNGPAVAAGETAAGAAAHRLLPVMPWRSRKVAAGTAVLAMALLTITVLPALTQPSEQRPVRALLDAVRNGDDLALAGLLAPTARTASASVDASAVLVSALGRSEIGFLTADWLRTLGPVTGTSMAFENLTLTTTQKDAATATVHLRGLFTPSSDNPITRVLITGLRRTFDTDVPVTNSEGRWFVAARAGVTPPPSSPSTVGSTGPTSPAVATLAPTPTPIRHLALGTYDAPGGPSVDAQGWRMQLVSTTIEVDESVVLHLLLTVGPTDGPWAARESRIEMASGRWLNVRASGSTFYEGGRGAGSVVPVALAFPPGLAGNQPYLIRVCGNLGYCWPPIDGPRLGER